MDKICFKILSVSIVLTVCSIESSASYADMQNVVRAIVISADDISNQTTNNSARLFYIINTQNNIPSDIKTILSIVNNQISIINNIQKHNKIQHLQSAFKNGNAEKSIIHSEKIKWNNRIQIDVISQIISAIRQRAGPFC